MTQLKPLDQDQYVPLVDLTPTPPIPNLIETEPDSFGLYRVYTDCPKVDPADEACVYDMCDAPTFTTPAPSTLSSHVGTRIKETFFTPFLNLTIYRLFGWFYNKNITKSIEDLNDLVVHVLLAPFWTGASRKVWCNARTGLTWQAHGWPSPLCSWWMAWRLCENMASVNKKEIQDWGKGTSVWSWRNSLSMPNPGHHVCISRATCKKIPFFPI